MPVRFCAEADPHRELCAALVSLAPANPFYTYAYTAAMRSMGFQPWVLALQDDQQVLSGCTAFLKSGRLNTSLEITSLPSLPDNDVFWRGLLGFCRDERITLLSVGSLASTRASIPALPGETGRRTRAEHILDLKRTDLWSMISANHRRNIKRAEKAGLALERRATGEACLKHAELQDASMARRQKRGESVAAQTHTRAFRALVGNGAGELFQVVAEDAVLSSILVLRSERGAYYHSAGTSPEGMAKGASHFLLYELCRVLQQESLDSFNLGGAEEGNPGLERFKAGFGSSKVQLEAVEFFLGGDLRRALGRTVQFLRDLAHADWFQRKPAPEAPAQRPDQP